MAWRAGDVRHIYYYSIIMSDLKRFASEARELIIHRLSQTSQESPLVYHTSR